MVNGRAAFCCARFRLLALCSTTIHLYYRSFYIYLDFFNATDDSRGTIFPCWFSPRC